MDKYIKNLLPRLKQYGQKLNKIESFVDKTWVLYNETNGFQTFRFKRGGRLIITTNGIIDECKWDYHAPDGLQINPSGKKGVMYRHAFFLESLFIMQVEGRSIEPVLFYNEAKIPDGDVFNYLKKIYISKNSLSSIGTQGKYYFEDTYGYGLKTGVHVVDAQLEIVDSKKIKIDNKEITIENGKIVSIVYNSQLDSESGILKIKSNSIIDEYNMISVGAEVRYPSNYLASGVIKIYNDSNVKKIHVKNGFITKVVFKNQPFLVVILVILMILILGIFCAVFILKTNQVPENQNTTIVDSIDARNIVFADDTVVSAVSPTVVDSAAYATDTQIDSYSLFEMTESSANEMELKSYLEKIFFKLHYINNNYPTEINKYIQAAKKINKKPIFINNLNKYVTFEDFLNDEDLCIRVSEIVKIDYSNESYFVDLNFYHV